MAKPALILISCFVSIDAAGKFIPQWPYDGFERFPTLWFGANVSGLDNMTQLSFVSKHSLAGYGWQQGVNRTNYRHGEMSLAQAALHLSDFVSTHRGVGNETPTMTFVYRHFQMSWAIFDITLAANDNSNNDDMFLKSNDNTGSRCGQVDAEHNTTSPLLVYLPLNQSRAQSFWVNQVVAEVALESGVNACFFDETVSHVARDSLYTTRICNAGILTPSTLCYCVCTNAGLELLWVFPHIKGRVPQHLHCLLNGRLSGQVTRHCKHGDSPQRCWHVANLFDKELSQLVI